MAKKKEQVEITAYKGFDADLKCRDHQYVVGATYTTEDDPVCCTENGFHSCEMPLDVWNYYGPATSRYATVIAGGAIDRGDGDSKIASATINVKAELRLPDFIGAAVRWILERAKANTATGDSGHAAATGNYGHAAATGTSGHAAATGNSGHAAATGNYGHAAATGNSGHAAATGDYGCCFVGFRGKAKAGATGAIAIAWYDEKHKRARIVSADVGENGIKPDTFYRVNDAGKLQEAV